MRSTMLIPVLFMRLLMHRVRSGPGTAAAALLTSPRIHTIGRRVLA
jgi:hypothetical protein